MYRKVSIVSAPLILRISRSSSAYIREGEGAYYTVLVKKRVSDNRIIVSIALSANISYLGGGGGGDAEEAYIQFFLVIGHNTRRFGSAYYRNFTVILQNLEN